MRDALISIKPRYTKDIISGKKTVELRSRIVNLDPGTTLWIYSTLPEGHLNIAAKVQMIDVDSPKNIWKRYSTSIGIDKNEYDNYVFGKSIVSAICMTSVIKIEPSVSLHELRQIQEGFQPPQFFKKLYPDDPLLRHLFALRQSQML